MLIPKTPMNLPSTVSKPLLSNLPNALIISKLSMAANDESSSPKDDDNHNNKHNTLLQLPPRARSVIYMGCAMALHFGGYEFIRNSCLALFTSSEFGFQSHFAFPLANGLVSPFSVLLLWAYNRQLEAGGPRIALRNTTAASIFIIALMSGLLYACQILDWPHWVVQALIGITFLFQNSYQYLLYTQQWSFVGSVLTPDEGSRWFAILAGFSSLLSTLTGALVPYLLSRLGLLGLMATTCLTLSMALFCSDRAYQLAETHGFNPADQMQTKKSTSEKTPPPKNSFSKAVGIFRREPTLRALLTEVLAFQSLNTILSVAFIRALKTSIPDDLMRSSYTGRFYSLINAVSTTLQLLILPIVMKYTEPATIWRTMPLIPLGICVLQFLQNNTGTDSNLSSLTLIAAAFFLAKTMDYSLRSVVYPQVYQPLDFESRYLGKEIIGVLGSRFGKSGMSLILSALTALGLTGLRQLNQFSLLAVTVWMASTYRLSNLIPRQAEAQAVVEERQRRKKVSKED